MIIQREENNLRGAAGAPARGGRRHRGGDGRDERHRPRRGGQSGGRRRGRGRRAAAEADGTQPVIDETAQTAAAVAVYREIYECDKSGLDATGKANDENCDPSAIETAVTNARGTYNTAEAQRTEQSEVEQNYLIITVAIGAVALIAIAVGAAQLALALALVVAWARKRASLNIEDLDQLKW